MSTPTETKSLSLPEGYFMDNMSQQSGVFMEVDELYQAVGWGELSVAEWGVRRNDQLALIGVRNATGELVGSGFLGGSIHRAWLYELAVNPDHRSQGIGRFIVQERVRIAQQLGIEQLETTLIRSNNLRSFYYQLGFEPHSTSVLVRQKAN